MSNNAKIAATPDFEGLVGCYYRPLYQFAFSLARNETEASDLTQQTFYVWATKGHQLRDAAKVKTWLSSSKRGAGKLVSRITNLSRWNTSCRQSRRQW